MARTRQIKPGFFLNEDLAAVSPLGRLLFAGLWTLADREGRLEDRPSKLRAEVLPYDRADGEKLIAQLADRGFLVRYVVDGNHYLQIVNFAQHQKPHPKEQPSAIPACSESESRGISAPSRDEDTPLHGETGTSRALPSESSSPSLPNPTDSVPSVTRAGKHKPVDEEFIGQMVEEFRDVLDEPQIRDELAKAKNRRQWDDYRDKRRHFHDWLGRAAVWAREGTTGGGSATAGGRPYAGAPGARGVAAGGAGRGAAAASEYAHDF